MDALVSLHTTEGTDVITALTIIVLSLSIVGGCFLLLFCWYGLPYVIRSLQAKHIRRVCREKGLIVLTYDDGPSENLTSRLLQQLKELDTKATFFVTGEAARERPEGVRAMEAGGHDIGSHSDIHLDSLRSSPLRAISDCTRGIRGLQKLGIHPKYFRPPYGKATTGTIFAARINGCIPVWWTHDSGDTGSVPGRVSTLELLSGRFGSKSRRAKVGDEDLLVARSKPEARAAFLDDLAKEGGVVLFHDSDRGSDLLEELTLTMTREIVERAQESGKTITTLDRVI